jgi:hypothetical protein
LQKAVNIRINVSEEPGFDGETDIVQKKVIIRQQLDTVIADTSTRFHLMGSGRCVYVDKPAKQEMYNLNRCWIALRPSG